MEYLKTPTFQFPNGESYSREWLEQHPNAKQRLLQRHYGSPVVCTCSQSSPELVIHRKNDYFLSRKPGTGSLHDRRCPLFYSEFIKELDNSTGLLRHDDKGRVHLSTSPYQMNTDELKELLSAIMSYAIESTPISDSILKKRLWGSCNQFIFKSKKLNEIIKFWDHQLKLERSYIIIGKVRQHNQTFSGNMVKLEGFRDSTFYYKKLLYTPSDESKPSLIIAVINPASKYVYRITHGALVAIPQMTSISRNAA